MQEGQAGLNFADEGEAAAFEALVQERLRRRQQRAGKSSPGAPHSPPPMHWGSPTLTPSPVSTQRSSRSRLCPPPGMVSAPALREADLEGTRGPVGCGINIPLSPHRAYWKPVPHPHGPW